MSLLQPGAVPSLTPELAMGMGITGLRLDSGLARASEMSLPPLVITVGVALLLAALPIPARKGCALVMLWARFLPLQA